MANQIADLAVRIGADTAELKRGLTQGESALQKFGNIGINIGAFSFCPCHLPLTLALAGTLLAGTAAGALLRSDLRPGDRVAPRTRGALSRAWLPLPTVNAGTVRPRGS